MKFKGYKRTVFYALVAGIFILINGIALVITPKWHPDHVVALLLGNLLLIGALFYFVYVYKLACRLKQPIPALENAAKSDLAVNQPFGLTEMQVQVGYRKTFVLLLVLSFVLPFFFMIHVPDSPHAWDYFVIFNSTTALQGHSFENLPMTPDRLGYFLRYPNNQFLGILFNKLFAPFAGNIQLKMWIVTAVSALLTTVGTLAGSLVVKSLSGKRPAMLYNVMAMGFIPFYLYGAQLYSDTVTLPFVSLSLLFFCYALKAVTQTQWYLWLAVGTLFAVVGFQFKPTVLIVLLAVLGYLLLNKKWSSLLVLFCFLVVGFVGTHQLVKTTVANEPAFSKAANDRYNLPMSHWLAMSWSPENKTGGFNKKIRLYSESFPNYAAKDKADKALLRDNFKTMGFGGVVRQIGRKLSYMWPFGDLNAAFYTYRHENPLVKRYFDYIDRGTKPQGNITGWFMLKAVQTIYWVFLVILLWREIWWLLSKKKNWANLWFIPALAFFGLSVFLILWETNSRYLYHFAPLMIALAAQNLTRLLDNKLLKTKGEEGR